MLSIFLNQKSKHLIIFEKILGQEAMLMATEITSSAISNSLSSLNNIFVT